MDIEIEIAGVADNRITYKLDVPRPIRHYFLKDTSYVEYDPGIDINRLDRSLLVIPVVGAITPTAWALGAGINTPVLDAAYLRALERFKEPFRALHPAFSCDGEIKAREERINPQTGKRAGLLYSGGVDSSLTYLRNRDKKPDLFSIWGVLDIPTAEKKFWNRMRADIRETASREGVETFQIKTDIFRNINHEQLTKEFGYGWWGEVSMGLFMLSMCAPAAVAREIGTLMISAAVKEGYQGPASSDPALDSKISWAGGMTVLHEGYDLSRQEKIEYLCREENRHYVAKLRVCWDSAGETNCGRCEKCLRTIAGLVVAGMHPNRCNFNIDNKTLAYLADCFNKGIIELHSGQIAMWRDIQQRAPGRSELDVPGMTQFLDWLKRFDFAGYRMKKLPNFLWYSGLILRNKRVKPGAIVRKMRCYYRIVLYKRKPPRGVPSTQV